MPSRRRASAPLTNTTVVTVILFEVEAEMSLTGEGRKQIHTFCEALGVASGSFGTNAWGYLLAMFTIDAVSHRQAVWRAMEMITAAARAAQMPEEPKTFKLYRRSEAEYRSQEVGPQECTCACHTADAMSYSSDWPPPAD